MRGERVVVKDFKGRALVRRIWSCEADVVYITDERGFADLQLGTEALVPIGFRRDDVFQLLDGLADGERVEWSRLKPYTGGPTSD